jgi:AcrR family transcriptional regulator
VVRGVAVRLLAEGGGATLGPVRSSDVAAVDAGGAAAPRAAQARVITAALGLFARHGVGATSLGMIAKELGVTKAAVYRQYKTRDAIVLAAAEAELARLAAVVEAAEAESSRERARDVLLEGMVDLCVERRRIVNTIWSDPVVDGFFAEHEGFRDVMRRLRRVLVGEGAGPEGRVRSAMLIAATSGAVTHPFVVGLDDEVLRVQLLSLARSFLGLPA